ncbi:Uncharacterized protein APZ42_008806 [Daphnia magna]|uniref:Uncharacterized protein n=1 Tax=Daphnia magna TaxID=35525 RepID=A0A164EEG1_9CRUS|nr:Uncharacterized protein APZ42_008806 [Daphnia magna]
MKSSFRLAFGLKKTCPKHSNHSNYGDSYERKSFFISLQSNIAPNGMPLLLEFLMNSSPQGMPWQQQDQRNHHQTQLLCFDSLCNYFLSLTDPVFEVSTLSQPSTTMNLVFPSLPAIIN